MVDMYRLLIILLLAGCVKEEPERGYTIGIPNNPNWHTGIEYNCGGMDCQDHTHAGYSSGWLGSFKGYNNGGTSEFRFNTITSGEINFIIIDTSNH